MNSTPRHNPALAVIVGGGIAASLDILYAFYRNGIANANELRVLQSVASGWLGKGFADSGIQGAMIGLASHFGILLVAAWIYFLASQRFAFLRTKWIACGAVFGVLVYLFMNFAVVPLSAAPFKIPHPPLRLLEGFVSHALIVGLPIAWAINRWTMRVLRA
jgi:hypothetical protein